MPRRRRCGALVAAAAAVAPAAADGGGGNGSARIAGAARRPQPAQMAGVTAASRVCSSRDYRAVYGECVGGERDVHYERQPEQHAGRCNGPARLTPDGRFAKRSCSCDLDEYQAEYSQCENGVRDVTGYAAKGGCKTDGSVISGLLEGSEKAPCPCTAADVGGHYTECDDSTRTRMVVFYWKRPCIPGATETAEVVKEVGDSLGLARHLHGEDGEWIVIDENGVLREVSPRRTAALPYVGHRLVSVQALGGAEGDKDAVELSDWKEDESGLTWESRIGTRYAHRVALKFEITLPEREHLPCHLQCDAGTYLAPPLTHCAYCPSGTYSFRGDTHAPPWKAWPPSFHTHCTGDDGCEPWQLRGDYIDSGDQNTKDSVTSTLNLWADIKTLPAMLHVTYRVESQALRDGMLIAVNDRQVWWDSGLQTDWKKTSVDLANDGLDCGWALNVSAPAFWSDGAPLNETNRHMCVWRNVFAPYKKELHFDPVGDRTHEYELVYADGLGCNESDYKTKNFQGKIAFVNRGICYFVVKTSLAQAAGAVGIIVMDNIQETQWIRMAGSSQGLHIPAYFISRERGLPIASALNASLPVRARIERTNTELGRLEMQLSYYKDATSSDGADRVFVKEILIEGTEAAARSCSPCPPGTYSHGGREHPDGCVPCPANTFAKDYNQEECLPCLESETSEPGAVRCIRSPVCQAVDYTPMYGNCTVAPGLDRGGPTLTVSFVANGCDPAEAGSAPAPAEREVACGAGQEGDCLSAGMYRSSATTCAECPQGQVPVAHPSDMTQYGSCRQCAAGEMPQFLMDYSAGFRRLNGRMPDGGVGGAATPSWSTRCNEPATSGAQAGVVEGCQRSGGWAFHSSTPPAAGGPVLPTTHLSAGRNLRGAEGVTLDLVLNLTLPVGGTLNFTYMLMPPKAADGTEDWAAFQQAAKHVRVAWAVYDVSDQTHAAKVPDLLSAVANSNFVGEEDVRQVTLPPGRYRSKWQYQKDAATNADVIFLLTAVTAVGDPGSPAARCVPCPDGVECVAAGGAPALCPAGRARPAGAADGCESCGDERVAERPGSSGCVHCAPGTAPREVAAAGVNAGAPFLHCVAGGDEAGAAVGGAEGECVVRLPEGVWNLTRLGGRYDKVTSGAGAEGGASGHLYVDVCDFVNYPRLPGARAGVCAARHAARENASAPLPPSFACLDLPDRGMALSLGEHVEVYDLRRFSNASGDAALGAEQPTGLTVRLTQGDRCPADPSLRLSADVSLICDPLEDQVGEKVGGRAPMVHHHKQKGGDPFSGGAAACRYEFSALSPAACPRCTKDSFAAVATECAGGKRLRQWVHVSGRPDCLGGFPRPPDEPLTCKKVVEVKAGANAVTAAIALAVVAMVVLATIVVGLYRKNSQLFVQYETLARQEQEGHLGPGHGRGRMQDTSMFDDSPTGGGGDKEPTAAADEAADAPA